MITIVEQFKQWQSALDDFQKSMESELAEIRQQKEEVLLMKNDLLDRLEGSYYVRNEKRIVLSAPEIIIGDVDRSGILRGMASRVVLRANNISLEGVGAGGSGIGTIESRASSIRQIAVDPGIDGVERAVKDISEVVSQARNITLRGEDAEGFFPVDVATGGSAGIHLSSDGYIAMDAVLPCETRSEMLGNVETGLNTSISDQEAVVSTCKEEISSAVKALEELLDITSLNDDDMSTRMNYVDIDELHAKFNSMSADLHRGMVRYFESLSRLAELNRQLDCVKAQKEKVSDYQSTYKEETTNSVISMNSERISLISRDGDGNLRTNAEAGIGIHANKVDINTYAYNGSLLEDSEVSISSKTVTVSTANPKVEEKSADYPAEGDVHIVSKNILMESVDYEMKDDQTLEKALTTEGSIRLRAESIGLVSTDTEGKATGKLSANAKAVEVKSMDVDKESGSDTALASGGTMLLVSEKMYAGAKDKSTKSTLLQISSDAIGLFGDTTVELQQGSGILQLNGGNASVSGSKVVVYGTTTMEGTTTFNSDVTAGTVNMKNLKVETSFSTPYTTEGVSIPSTPSSGKLSTKLTEEEMKSSN